IRVMSNPECRQSVTMLPALDDVKDKEEHSHNQEESPATHTETAEPNRLSFQPFDLGEYIVRGILWWGCWLFAAARITGGGFHFDVLARAIAASGCPNCI